MIKKIPPCQHKLNPRAHVKHLQDYLLTYNDYILQKQREAGGAPVFRICPGHSMVAVADHASVEFVVESPLADFTRIKQKRKVNLVAPKAMIKDTLPPLVARNKKHQQSRGLLDEIYQFRSPDLLSAVEYAFNKVIEQMLGREQLVLREELVYLAQLWPLYWLFEITPEKEALVAMDANFGVLNTDSKLANLFLPGTPKPVEVFLEQTAEMIRQSKYFSQYQALAQKHGVPLKNLEHNLMTSCLINAGAVTAFQTFPALIRMNQNPQTTERLRAENQTSPYQFYQRDSAPWLDCIFNESIRLHSQKQMSRMAARDLDIPAGDGNSYRVKKGEEVVVLMPFAHRDPSVWQDAETFDPARFEREPGLKQQLFIFGRREHSPTPYGCAGSKGISEHVFKYIVNRFCCEFDWDFLQKPSVSLNTLVYGAPRDLMLTHFRPIDERSPTHKQQAENSDSLLNQFREACEQKNRLLGYLGRDEIEYLYGLYKQALYGDADPEPPKLSQFNKKIGLLKHAAWLAQKGKSTEQAYQAYVDKVAEVQARQQQAAAKNKPKQPPTMPPADNTPIQQPSERCIHDEEEMFLSEVYSSLFGDDDSIQSHPDAIYSKAPGEKSDA